MLICRYIKLDLHLELLVLDHYSAQIEEISAGGEEGGDRRYVVDSWFFDNGQSAVVMPLGRWMSGESPDGGG